MLKYYNDLNSNLKSIFGHRVHKITVDTGLSCPNRDGLIGKNGCIYCNENGSGNGLFSKGMSIKQQINNSIPKISKRFKAKKFIVYFQSFSNTYAPIEKLKQIWDEALSIKNIVGLAIATRPDCVNNSLLDVLREYAKKYFICIEYGLQSSHDKTLTLLNRGHNVNCFTQAVKLTKKRQINVCAHIILGLPNETKELMLETADFLSRTKIDSIKIHLLYVIKNTKMEAIYKANLYKCLEQDEYVTLVCDFIERLSPNIIIQRLTSDPHPDELVAPLWAIQKNETLTLIHDLFESRNTWQGKMFDTKLS